MGMKKFVIACRNYSVIGLLINEVEALSEESRPGLIHDFKYLDRIIVRFSLFDSAQSDSHAERSRSIVI
jgi:hypothetical protein